MNDHWIKKGRPAIVLAPMDGVTDFHMRDLLTSNFAFTHCVSEFLRISNSIPSDRIYFEYAPELKTGAQTRSGAALIFQLLGGDAHLMAEAACRGVEFGARSIDLNFGCPAPTVNRHDGGAALLKSPHRIREIVSKVREAVPKEVPVSVKMRLGFDSHEPLLQNAEAAAEAGADWICIHARTKVQGYAPPVFWPKIGEVVKRLDIPVIANGDIWSLEDFKRCRDESLAEHFMVGRGALANPFLVQSIQAELGMAERPSAEYPSADIWKRLFLEFLDQDIGEDVSPKYKVQRMKQWVSIIHKRRPTPFFDSLKTLREVREIEELVHRQLT